MRSAWTRVCSSALGVASSVILMAFNARRMLGFIRGQFACRACEDNLGTVFLLGNAYVLSDLASVVLYDFLFKALPHFFLSFFPAWAFWSWHGGLDLGLRQLCPVFLLVVGFVAVSDVCNLVGTPCYGEAAACGSVRDACLFGVFLLHRFSPLAFFALVWRRGFAKLPRLLLIIVFRIIRWLDFWGLMPKALTEGDTNYSTVLVSNLGSIKCPAVYHHLNNYGTNSIMVTLGTLHKEEMLMPDGTRQVRDVVDIGATLDERIADGFYFARSLKLIKYVFGHPELLDRPLSEPSGFEYK